MVRRVVVPVLLLVFVALAVVLAFLPPYRTEEVRWSNGEVELAGTLYVPTGAGPYPAAVFVHGAGAWTREAELFHVHAARLARSGLALLIYDKRGCGVSTGDWRSATFEELAADTLGAVELLRADPRFTRVGLFATSQGGAVALLANERSAVAFLATLSLSPLSPEAQERDLVERGVDLRLEPTPRSRDFDPLPYLERLEVPLFVAQGGDDALVPGPRAADALRTLSTATVVLVPGAEHSLRPWPAGYWAALDDWLAAVVFGR